MTDRVTERQRLGLWARLKRVALTDVGTLVRGFKAADIAAMEQLLLEADFGIAATTDLVELLEDGVRRGRLKTEADLRAALEARLAELLASPGDPGRIARAPVGAGPTVVLVMGVNGAGKTTTIAKLARRLTRDGEKVLLAAADTYRAGAVAQLEIWARRLGLPCVSGAAGGDPAAVAFDALEAAAARGATVAIVDTAGRLHTQEGLMEELRKIVRVIGRKSPGAPQEALLVLDGTVGQNAVQQGRLFAQAVTPTGLVITKLDGTAKGGAVVALRRELALPIRFLGTGEQADDLQVFDPVRYAADLLADGPEATTGDR
jgi:fused signal recognition particle receptor